jgi:hypothetical protein
MYHGRYENQSADDFESLTCDESTTSGYSSNTSTDSLCQTSKKKYKDRELNYRKGKKTNTREIDNSAAFFDKNIPKNRNYNYHARKRSDSLYSKYIQNDDSRRRKHRARRTETDDIISPKKNTKHSLESDSTGNTIKRPNFINNVVTEAPRPKYLSRINAYSSDEREPERSFVNRKIKQIIKNQENLHCLSGSPSVFVMHSRFGKHCSIKPNSTTMASMSLPLLAELQNLFLKSLECNRERLIGLKKYGDIPNMEEHNNLPNTPVYVFSWISYLSLYRVHLDLVAYGTQLQQIISSVNALKFNHQFSISSLANVLQQNSPLPYPIQNNLKNYHIQTYVAFTLPVIPFLEFKKICLLKFATWSSMRQLWSAVQNFNNVYKINGKPAVQHGIYDETAYIYCPPPNSELSNIDDHTVTVNQRNSLIPNDENFINQEISNPNEDVGIFLGPNNDNSRYTDMLNGFINNPATVISAITQENSGEQNIQDFLFADTINNFDHNPQQTCNVQDTQNSYFPERIDYFDQTPQQSYILTDMGGSFVAERNNSFQQNAQQNETVKEKSRNSKNKLQKKIAVSQQINDKIVKPKQLLEHQESLRIENDKVQKPKKRKQSIKSKKVTKSKRVTKTKKKT